MICCAPRLLIRRATISKIPRRPSKCWKRGASTLSKEESGRLAQRQLKFIQHLEAALVRIENKTYGICRETGKLIPKERCGSCRMLHFALKPKIVIVDDFAMSA